MKRTQHITIGVVAALALAACGSGESNADYNRICLDENGVRVEDHNCPDDDSRNGFFYPIWLYGHTAAPAVGSRPPAGSYVTTKPATGSIARPPAKGGFGTFRSGGSSGG